jgi:hypothetical protein
MECPEMINERQELSFDDFKQELFDQLPDFIKEKISMSDEYKTLKPSEDVVPF